MQTPLVEVEWLAEHLNDPNLVILDATFQMPNSGLDAQEMYLAAHIPNALFFDVNAIADKTNPLPHMLPIVAEFARAIAPFGIDADTNIVVYDTQGVKTAGRAWWMFRVMGHQNVHVLNGGLKKWQAVGLSVTNAPVLARAAGDFVPVFNKQLLRDCAQIRDNIESRREQIVDARSAGRFWGREAEPRAGLRGGHIPGACNMPVDSLTNSDGTLKSAAELRTRLTSAGVDLERPIVTSCGSGVTAATLALALAVLGRFDVAVYDGSWAEWGGLLDTPVAV